MPRKTSQERLERFQRQVAGAISVYVYNETKDRNSNSIVGRKTVSTNLEIIKTLWETTEREASNAGLDLGGLALLNGAAGEDAGHREAGHR